MSSKIFLKRIKKTGCISTHQKILQKIQNQAKHVVTQTNEELDILAQKQEKQSIIELPNMKYFTPNLVYDQGDIGSCTANAIAFAVRYLSVTNSPIKDDFTNKNPYMLSISRLAQYWNTRFVGARFPNPRLIKYETGTDCGGSIGGAVLALDLYGAYAENTKDHLANFEPLDKETDDDYCLGWPYDITQLTKRPDPEFARRCMDSDQDGVSDKGLFANGTGTNLYSAISRALRYEDLTSSLMSEPLSEPSTKEERKQIRSKILNSLKQAHPVYIGIVHDDSFFDIDPYGRIQTPDPTTFKSIGAHALVITGHGKYFKEKGDTQQYYRLMNSWGLPRNDMYGTKVLNKMGIQDDGCIYLKKDYIENVKTFSLTYFSLWFDQPTYQKSLQKFITSNKLNVLK